MHRWKGVCITWPVVLLGAIVPTASQAGPCDPLLTPLLTPTLAGPGSPAGQDYWFAQLQCADEEFKRIVPEWARLIADPSTATRGAQSPERRVIESRAALSRAESDLLRVRSSLLSLEALQESRRAVQATARIEEEALGNTMALEIESLRQQESALVGRIRDLKDDAARQSESLAGSSATSEVGVLWQDLGNLRMLYQGLLETVDQVDVLLPAEAWCSLQIHGGITRLLAGAEGSHERLLDGTGAWGGTCRQKAVALYNIPLFQSAFAEAMFEHANRPPANVVLAWDDGLWTIDGYPAKEAQYQGVLVNAGLHRVERVSEEGTIAVATVEMRPGENLYLEVNRGSIRATERVPSRDGRWPTFEPGEGVFPDDGGQTPHSIVGEPPPGPVCLGPMVGYSYNHLLHFGVIGLGGAWDVPRANRLSLEVASWAEIGTYPVYLSRWESETRMVRLLGAARWDLAETLKTHPFLDLGVLGELSVGAGPTVGAGVNIPLSRRTDIDVRAGFAAFVPQFASGPAAPWLTGGLTVSPRWSLGRTRSRMNEDP